MSLCYNMRTKIHDAWDGGVILGYREFAKDYRVEYVNRPGSKRSKAIRVYVGPWFKFVEAPEKIRFIKWFYLIGMAVMTLLLLTPLCIDCTFSRIWYVQMPAVVAWIPWVFAVCATWRLWTAKEQVEREHNAMLGGRMSPATLFMAVFSGLGFMGSIYACVVYPKSLPDYVIMGCSALATVCAIVLFSRRKSLKMVQI